MANGVLIGCVADDLTGATDVAGTLAREGMRVSQIIGVPDRDATSGSVDAVVVALKSRSIAAADAVEQSRRSLRWLLGQGSAAIYFKYCSTFDSTDAGNIGPVADAMLSDLGESYTVAVPAFPRQGRTVYSGNLFVNGVPLSESHMRHHPVTPMTDSNLVRVLGRQTDGLVGLVDYATVVGGSDAIQGRLASMASEGFRYSIVDALDERHLEDIAGAIEGFRLATGGSALAGAQARRLADAGAFERTGTPAAIELESTGGAAVLAGSCARATLAQVERMRSTNPSYMVDPEAIAAGRDVAGEALSWADGRIGKAPVLIYSSADAAAVDLAADIEDVMRAIAAGLLHMGVDRFVVAGGETAGAVVEGLGVKSLSIGREIVAGVPITWSSAEPRVGMVLKSGNFGAEDFFARALEGLGA